MKTISVFLLSVLLLCDFAWLCGGQANQQGMPGDNALRHGATLDVSADGAAYGCRAKPLSLSHTSSLLRAFVQWRMRAVDLFSHFFPGMGKKSDYSGTSTSAHAEATSSVKRPGKAAEVEGKGDVSTQTKSIITTSARSRRRACKKGKCHHLTLLSTVTSCDASF